MLGYGRSWRSAQVIPSWGAFLCAAFRSSRPTPQRAGRYSPTHSLSSLARRSAWRRAVGGRRRSEPPLEFRAIGLHPLIDPAEYRVVPEHTVGRFEHPVILRLEVEKFRRDVLGLQHLEHRQALARIDAVVVAAVDDEHRGAEASLGRNLRSGSHDCVPVCPRAAIRGPAFPTPGLRLLLVGFVEALKTRNAPQCRLCAAASVACCAWTIGNAKIIKPDRQSLWVYPQSRAAERKGIASRKQGGRKMHTRRAATALVVGLAVSIAMRPDVAAAQSSPGNGAGPGGGAPLQEVVVTGTSIKGINAETALPVQVLKSEDIARTGATTAEELFEQISAASSSGLTNAAQATGFQTGAISTISLRGLDSARTLILINGRRSAPYGGGSVGTAGNSVDISAIPISMIDRVEILNDGASAISGSGATAGGGKFH